MDRRPYPHGLDDIELSNLMRAYFKWDKLFEDSLKSIEKEEPELFNKHKNVIEKSIAIAIGSIEDTVRSDLYEYTESFEHFKSKYNAYINGLLDAAGTPIEEGDINEGY